jgi:hypothetical protein
MCWDVKEFQSNGENGYQGLWATYVDDAVKWSNYHGPEESIGKENKNVISPLMNRFSAD